MMNQKASSKIVKFMALKGLPRKPGHLSNGCLGGTKLNCKIVLKSSLTLHITCKLNAFLILERKAFTQMKFKTLEQGL